MKAQKILLPLIIGLVATVVGCKKEPFAGDDNYITEFTLSTPDQQVFTALIQENTLTLEMPRDVNRQQLTPQYVLSELASINPKPESVDNWDEAPTFTVTSHNGATREYHVKITLSDLFSNDDVILRTQADVEKFAAKSISRIQANLIIGDEDIAEEERITQLNSLTDLEEVRGKLIITPAYKGEVIELPYLRTTGNVEIITSQESNIQKISFPALEYIYGNLYIEAPTTTTISFPQLKETENLTLDAVKNLKQIDFSNLENALNIEFKNSRKKYTYDRFEENNTVSEINLPKLQKAQNILIEGFQSLSNLRLSSLTTCNNIDATSGHIFGDNVNDPITYSPIALFEAKNLIEVYEEIDVVAENIELSKLKKVKKITLYHLSKKTTLSSLEEVQDFTLHEYYPTLLKNMKVIENLTCLFDHSQYKGDIDLTKFQSLHRVELSSCSKINNFTLPKKINQFEASGLPNKILGVEECENFSIITDDLSKIELPETLTKVQRLLIQSKGSLKTVVGKNLKYIGSPTQKGSFKIEYTEGIFPELEAVYGELQFSPIDNHQQNPPPYNFDEIHMEWPKLQHISNLNIIKNNIIKNLNFISNVSTIDYFNLKFCANLKDYSGLKKAVEAGGITKEGWEKSKIEDNGYNPTFEDLQEGRYTEL